MPKQPQGQLRQSQLLTTFGPGAMVDLPTHSVIISGLNRWNWQKGETKRRIYEDRLAVKVCKALEVEDIAFYAPPVETSEQGAGYSGIDAFIFPTWFVAQINKSRSRGSKEYRTRPLVKWDAITRKKVTIEGKKAPVVPVRFVQACLNGHISDLDWYGFVHKDPRSTCCGQLWLDEAGSGNDFADIFVRCEACGKLRPLSDATLQNYGALGLCGGDRPWLGENHHEQCRVQKLDDEGNLQPTEQPEQNRLLVRSASNSYFPQILSAISLPDSDALLKETVDAFYNDDLQYLEDVGELKKELRKPKYAELSKFDLETVWEEVSRRKQGLKSEEKSIKRAEIETLLSADEVGADEPGSDFYSRLWKRDNFSPVAGDRLDRIILVDRLREVMVQLGFTRFEGAIADVDGELSVAVRRAELGLETDWIPAIEVRGEGVFIAFNKKRVEAWQELEAVKERGKILLQGFQVWRDARGLSEKQVKFPGMPYIMLHTVSHLLLIAVTLQCGYGASALKERIYAVPEVGYGILLYTGSSGSEGTLGGLIEVGKNIEHYLESALDIGKLCSNDPVCSQHVPNSEQEDRLLHGSACHGCLFVAETSCEKHNEFLDRALVLNTLEKCGAEFFESLTV
jgi:hypothetical protein